MNGNRINHNLGQKLNPFFITKGINYNLERSTFQTEYIL